MKDRDKRNNINDPLILLSPTLGAPTKINKENKPHATKTNGKSKSLLFFTKKDNENIKKSVYFISNKAVGNLCKKCM